MKRLKTGLYAIGMFCFLCAVVALFQMGKPTEDQPAKLRENPDFSTRYGME